MNRASVFPLLAICLVGCRHSIAQYDEFEKVQVQRMVGNEVHQTIISRTVLCLNAMREVRWPGPLTNQTVTLVTNYTVSTVTNQTVSNSAQDQSASNTNVVAGLSVNLQLADQTNEITTNIVTTPQPQDSAQVGTTLSSLRTESIATAPNQSVLSRTHQTVSLVSNQSTVNTNNQAYVLGSNQTITTETNWVITTVTNAVVVPVTNVVVTVPDKPVIDYYLYTEIAPQDFTLAPGENLVLLVDGIRGSFTPVTPLSGWQLRSGYLTTYYKVPADLVVAIANSQEVRLRIRGNAGTLERTLSDSSRNNFRKFLLDNVSTGNFEDKLGEHKS